MRDYRIYVVTKYNHFERVPPVIITCENDKEAIQKAQKLEEYHDIELWDGAGQIIRIKSERAYRGSRMKPARQSQSKRSSPRSSQYHPGHKSRDHDRRRNNA